MSLRGPIHFGVLCGFEVAYWAVGVGVCIPAWLCGVLQMGWFPWELAYPSNQFIYLLVSSCISEWGYVGEYWARAALCEGDVEWCGGCICCFVSFYLSFCLKNAHYKWKVEER